MVLEKPRCVRVCASGAHLDAEQIRLELHEKSVGRHAPVYLEAHGVHPAVLVHGAQHLLNLRWWGGRRVGGGIIDETN